MLLMKRALRIPLVVLAVASVVGIILLTVNVMSVAHDAARWASVRSDLRTGLATTILLMAVWIAAVLVLDEIRALRNRVDALTDAAGDATLQLPRLRSADVVVGTAALKVVDTPSDNVRAFEVGRRVGRQERER